jgi:hypothetical protein
MYANPKSTSRYIVGIDLGTSSCSLAYFDTHCPEKGLQIMPIAQWVGSGQLGELPLLPSFCYFLEKHEIKNQQFALCQFVAAPEGSPYLVGSFARTQASSVPDRVAHAAKSWLCHGGVDRRNNILPWHSESILGEKRISPVFASSLYLQHLRLVWNQRIAAHDPVQLLEEQQIVITVPASFDEIASALTLDAAEMAGLPRRNLRLLEEPQAAWYFWQYSNSGNTLIAPEKLQQLLRVQPGQEQLVLVCDIGGGTTDFSLLKVAAADASSLEIRRVEVSTHILLGGDNFDLALSYFVESRAKEQGLRSLSRRQWAKLLGDARWLKEKAFAAAAAGEARDYPLHLAIAPDGARLLGQGATLSLSQGEIVDLIVEGFFPLCAKDAPLREKASSLKEWGLPHPQESAITRHLADFLKGRSVDGVLCTGGSLLPQLLRERLFAQIAAWQEKRPLLLENSDYELSVCAGAAVYGACLRHQEGQVASGYPRSLYLAVAAKGEAKQSLVCIVPRGFSGEETLRIDQVPLQALVGQAVAFTLWASPQRADKAGAVLNHQGDDVLPLPPLCTVLQLPGASPRKTGQLLKVQLEVNLSATGLLTIYCVGAGEAELRWPLTFNVQEAGFSRRTSSSEERDEKHDSTSSNAESSDLHQVGQRLAALFGKRDGSTGNEVKSKLVWQFLESTLGGDKYTWDLQLLRRLWDLIKEGETRRGRSREHEALWLSLAGFCLRPGYGLEDDSFRMDRLWQAYGRGGPFFPQEKRVEDQWWIMWRRTAGGLDRERQEKLCNKVFPQLRSGQASPEVILLLGALERVEMQKRLRLAEILLEQVTAGKSKFLEQKMWALTRIASRRPLYAGADTIVPPAYVERWCVQLADMPSTLLPAPLFVAFAAAAGRKLDDRNFDISEESREQFIAALTRARASAGQIKQVAQYCAVDKGSYEQLFGEQLPPGIVLG